MISIRMTSIFYHNDFQKGVDLGLKFFDFLVFILLPYYSRRQAVSTEVYMSFKSTINEIDIRKIWPIFSTSESRYSSPHQTRNIYIFGTLKFISFTKFNTILKYVIEFDKTESITNILKISRKKLRHFFCKSLE